MALILKSANTSEYVGPFDGIASSHGKYGVTCSFHATFARFSSIRRTASACALPVLVLVPPPLLAPLPPPAPTPRPARRPAPAPTPAHPTTPLPVPVPLPPPTSSLPPRPPLPAVALVVSLSVARSAPVSPRALVHPHFFRFLVRIAYLRVVRRRSRIQRTLTVVQATENNL